MFAWRTYLWRYSETQSRLWFGKISKYLRDNEDEGYTKTMKYTLLGFQFPFKDNNIPRDFEPTPVEINLPFFVRYVNWILDKVQSPPQQHSPPKERSPSPQLMSPPMQRSPSPWNQFQGADYTSASHFQETSHGPVENSKIDKLFCVVNELKTTIEHFGKRMDNWEKDKQFGVNDMENVDVREAFFGGLGPESGHTYVHTPPPVVDVEDNTATPIKGWIKMKSKFCRDPYTQVPSMTEPLKNRKGKKHRRKIMLQKDNYYADCDDEFWKLWGKKMGVVFVEHRLLRGIDMNWEFWSTLLGIGSGWFLSEEISSSNCRWTIINPEGTTLEPGKQHYLRRISAGMVDGPHWKDIDRVLIPINIPQLHWYLVDLDLLTWKVTIYDSAEWRGFFKKIQMTVVSNCWEIVY
ncbi:unnamed protein product [Lactuca saligna]|uniref:Ubiquitin-like protease family profile domain-containing protein n=1 Tax=Lactuca saligna TaxID=75948 RepID=A0AA35VTL3_LACSI|nr:unnamed protein product [Lactuca saligna]